MKKLLALILALSMMLTLAACSTTPAEEAPVEGETSATESQASGEESSAVLTEEITIKFANHMVLEAASAPFWEQFKADFEAQYPNITIEYVSAPYGEIMNTVINMAGGGDKVDLMVGEAGWTSTLADAGLTVPVAQVMGEEYASDFLPGVLEATTVNGEIYGTPMYMTPFVLFYNKDIFVEAGLDPEAPPTTYDEMLEAAEAISALTTADGNKIYPFGQTTGAVSVSGTSLTAMVYNFGGEILTADGQLSTDNDGFKQAFEMLAELDEMGYNPQNALLKDLRNLFALGQLGMYYDQAWGYSGVSSINPEAASFTATAAPLAGGSGSGDSVVSAHTLFYTDNGDLQKEAVKLLVEMLVTEETLSGFISETNLAYPAKNDMLEMEAIKNSSILSGASNALDSAKAVPAIPALADLNIELTTLAQAVTVGDQSFDDAYPTFKAAAEGIVN